MPPEKTFKTKTGFCHILPDKIVLTRDGIIGNMANVTVGNNIARILLLYGGISLALFYFAYTAYRKGNVAEPFVLGLIGIYLLYGIAKSIHYSATPVIERNKIRTVEFIKAIPGVTRSRFVVHFENEKGKKKKRLILLPGSVTGGPEETTRALQLMTEEKLITIP